jgi:mRNA interferase HigB
MELPIEVTFLSLSGMRIIKEKTLADYCRLSKYKKAEDSLKAWIYEAKFSTWNNSNELKAKYRNASIISSKRVVFNIKGNDYRLIVDVEFKLKIVFIVWFGTHMEYNKIDAKKVKYEN